MSLFTSSYSPKSFVSHKLFIVIYIVKQKFTMMLEHLLVLVLASLTFCFVQSGKG